MRQDKYKMMLAPASLKIGGCEIDRGSTPRTHRLAMDAINREYLPCAEQRQLTREYKPKEGISQVLQDAYRFAYVHSRLTPVVRDDELIVGARLRGEDSGISFDWLPDSGEGWVKAFIKSTPGDRPDIKDMAVRGLISPCTSFGHRAADYAGFINIGSNSLVKRSREMGEERTGEERDLSLAFVIGHEAIMEHAIAYAAACEQKAQSACPERAKELREIARICRKVPAYPPETFHEALQSFWFAYMAAGDGTGRIDVYLNHFYQADLVAGRITPEKAQELIECLLIKFHGDYPEGVINVSSIHTITLGGILTDGSDAANDLTRLFLSAARKVRLLRPTIYLRCHENTPNGVLDLAVEMLGEGLAEPSFFYDKPVINGLTRLGIPVEVARNYAISGCAELVSPGRGNWGAPTGWVNIALVVDEALRSYARSEDKCSEKLWDTIEKHIEDLAEICRECSCWLDDTNTSTSIETTLLMPICLERGRDVANGGAESYLAHWEGVGLPNAVDMIYAAEQLCFIEGQSLPSLFQRIDDGDDDLFLHLRRLPKFGNDCKEVDKIAARLVNTICEALERKSTSVRTALTLGHLSGGQNMHIAYGLLMGPTLDGRKRGQCLADSLVGSQGTNKSGPTAVIRSLCSFNHSMLPAGSVSTLRLGKHDFASNESRENVIALIRTYGAMGGSQLQINMADAKELREAQLHPELYEGLMVRVAGYSAVFNYLRKEVQDEIIARTDGVL